MSELKLNRMCIKLLCEDTHGNTWAIVNMNSSRIMMFGPVVRQSKTMLYKDNNGHTFDTITHEEWKAGWKRRGA